MTGTANRFGYFYPSDSGITLDQPGVYRVDITATFEDDAGNLWMGSRTWGGVIAPQNPSILAHGRRGIDSQDSIGNQWFFRTDTGIEIGGSHLHFPFNSSDVSWLKNDDSVVLLVTFQDPGGEISSLMGQRPIPALWPTGSFEERAAVGEIPLFSSAANGWDPHIDPSNVDPWAYSYRSVQRPLVRVREQIEGDPVGGQYWRFDDQYAAQIGVGPNGDLLNDIKFQYGAAVIRGSAVETPKYAIYGSLFVLIPNEGDAIGGSRTFPPFQGNGGGPDGGPIMTLQGRDIDLFIHLTGVRPGTILEVDDTFSIAGAVGPTLAATVSTTVTTPGGQVIQSSGLANRIGYYYQPGDDFAVEEPGLYTVDVTVTYDGMTSAGQVTAPFPTGDVLGTAAGRFYVYVVSPDSDVLNLNVSDGFVSTPVQLSITATSDLTFDSAHVTAMMPGFVLETQAVAASGNNFQYSFDASTFVSDFPNLDTDGSDVLTLTLFASGTNAQGQPVYGARHVVLHGRQLLSLDTVMRSPFSIPDRGGTSLITTGEAAQVNVGYARVQPAAGSTSPSGIAIFGFSQGGVLISEAGVPASPLVQGGRIYAEVEGALNTGIAIANPNAEEASISLFFTDSEGTDFGTGILTLGANEHISKFLSESPFNSGSPVNGTFTFSSSIPVSVIALRGLTNERGEFLITTLPVAPLTAAGEDTIYLPHFADGAGWTTQVVLVNPTDATITGTVQFLGEGSETTSAEPVTLTLDDSQIGSEFTYAIPARSSRRLRTSNSAALLVGSVRVIRDATSSSASGLVIFSAVAGGVTVTEAGVSASPASTAFRMYAEVSGTPGEIGSLRSGLAIANTSSTATTAVFELTTLDGTSTGLTASTLVPGSGHVSIFVDELFPTLATPFQGVLRISSTSTPLAVVGLRARTNKRGDFLITTTPPTDEAGVTTTDELLFPQLADSGGWTT